MGAIETGVAGLLAMANAAAHTPLFATYLATSTTGFLHTHAHFSAKSQKGRV
jgi:hypothetical protein